MLPPAKNNKARGFTLIEVMMAMLIMTVGLMALLQTLGYAISFNFSNKLKSDAIMVADRAMMRERVNQFANITSVNTVDRVPFALGFVNYSVFEKVTKIGTSDPAASKNVLYTVSWRDKGVKKQLFLTTIIGN